MAIPITHRELEQVLEKDPQRFVAEKERWVEAHRQRLVLTPKGLRANLSGLDLSNVEFRYTTFDSTDFSRAKLSGAVFNRCEFHRSKFWESDLTDATFVACKFYPPDFAGAHLERTLFFKSLMDGLCLPKVHLEQADFTACSAKGADLTSATGNKVFWIKVNFKGAKLSGIKIVRLYCRLSGFEEADLSGAVLEEAVIEKSVLYRADFSSARLRGAKLTGSWFDQTSFRGADLTGADLRGCDITKAIFDDAVTEGVMFDEPEDPELRAQHEEIRQRLMGSKSQPVHGEAAPAEED